MNPKFDPKPISNALLTARRNCTPLAGFPGCLPETFEQAYAVQMESISNWVAPLVGFKVGGIPSKFQSQFPARWQVGPIFEDQVYKAETGDNIEVSVFEGGFSAYEAELVFVVKNCDALPSKIDSIEEATSFIDRVYLGAEIASSPNSQVNALGPGSIISDFGTNAGVVLGPEAPLPILDKLSELEVSLYIDNEEIGRAAPIMGEAGPLGALRHALNHISNLSGRHHVPESCYISSGAITGVHQSKVGTTARINFGQLTNFELKMVARKPIA